MRNPLHPHTADMDSLGCCYFSLQHNFNNIHAINSYCKTYESQHFPFKIPFINTPHWYWLFSGVHNADKGIVLVFLQNKNESLIFLKSQIIKRNTKNINKSQTRKTEWYRTQKAWSSGTPRSKNHHLTKTKGRKTTCLWQVGTLSGEGRSKRQEMKKKCRTQKLHEGTRTITSKIKQEVSKTQEKHQNRDRGTNRSFIVYT